MINVILGPNIILGIIFVLSLLLIASVREVRPELSEDEDGLVVICGLLYSCIFIVHGWRLDPILLFSQVLLMVPLIIVVWKAIRTRAILLEVVNLVKKQRFSKRN